MEPEKQKISTVQFKEHPHSLNQTDDELAIIVSKPFSNDKYCEALFHEILTIGLSESASFLDYQCSRVKNPVLWLNTIEKLIKDNANLFDTNNYYTGNSN